MGLFERYRRWRAKKALLNLYLDLEARSRDPNLPDSVRRILTDYYMLALLVNSSFKNQPLYDTTSLSGGLLGLVEDIGLKIESLTEEPENLREIERMIQDAHADIQLSIKSDRNALKSAIGVLQKLDEAVSSQMHHETYEIRKEEAKNYARNKELGNLWGNCLRLRAKIGDNKERIKQLKGWDKYIKVSKKINKIMIHLRAPSAKAPVPKKHEQLEEELKNLDTALSIVLEGKENNLRSATSIARRILKYL